MTFEEIKQQIEEIIAGGITREQEWALRQMLAMGAGDRHSHMFDSEEEYKKQKEFEDATETELEDAGWSHSGTTMWRIDFESMAILLKLMVGNLNFSERFRVLIDYDPQMKKVKMNYCTVERENKGNEGDL